MECAESEEWVVYSMLKWNLSRGAAADNKDMEVPAVLSFQVIIWKEILGGHHQSGRPLTLIRPKISNRIADAIDISNPVFQVLSHNFAETEMV